MVDRFSEVRSEISDSDVEILLDDIESKLIAIERDVEGIIQILMDSCFVQRAFWIAY